MFESVRVQLERHEGDVARIHGLELEPLLRIRLEVGVGDEILDGVEDFLEHRPLGESRFEHGRSRPRVARWRDRRDFEIDRARWSACENAEASARRRETRDERRDLGCDTKPNHHAWDVRGARARGTRRGSSMIGATRAVSRGAADEGPTHGDGRVQDGLAVHAIDRGLCLGLGVVLYQCVSLDETGAAIEVEV